jgi:hypothetical protein
VTALFRSGYRVFLFGEARRELAKFDFRVKPVVLRAETFPEYLKNVRDGDLVVVAATPGAAAGLMSDPRAWSGIGMPESHVFRRAGVPYAVIGVGGARGGALEGSDRPDTREVELTAASGAAVGTTGVLAPADIRAYADGQTAVISVGGEEPVRTNDGAVVALVGPRGGAETFVLDLAGQFRVPMDMRPLPLFELTEAATCINLGNLGWRDVSIVPFDGRVTVRIDNYRPFLSHATFYVVSDRPAVPTLTEGPGTGVPALAVRSFRVDDPADAAALARSLADDQLALPGAARSGTYVSRAELSVDDNGDYKSTVLAFGVQPTQTMARITVDRDSERRATLCGSPPG